MGIQQTESIHIIGLGVSETAVLSGPAQTAITYADIIIGSDRQLLTIAGLLSGDEKKTKCILLPPLKALTSLIDSYNNKSVVVLASGDPLYFGIGRWFVKHFAWAQLRFYPAISSIQAACHEVGLALQDVDVISLHGRPLEKIRTKLHRNKKLLILTDKYSRPQTLAQECVAAGFAQSRLTVCENLGYQQQTIRSFLASELGAKADILFDPLHITVIDIIGNGGVLPEFPGIADTQFITGKTAGKGMISKREVRLVILSLLQASASDIIWDIGAGCGGVSVELAYWNEAATVYAIEHHRQRLEYLKQNCQRFGVSDNVTIVPGRAPEVLKDLPTPTKIFIGGSDGELNSLLNKTWNILPIQGVLVASAVIEATKKTLLAFAQSSQGAQLAQVESIEVSIKRGDITTSNRAETSLVYEKRLPVEIFKLTKLRSNIYES